MKQEAYIRGIYYLLLLICIIGIATIMKIAVAVILPVTVSIVFSLVFLPIVTNMNKKLHVPWILGIFICLIVLFSMVYVIGNLLVASIKSIISVYPKYEDRFGLIYKILAGRLHWVYDSSSSFFQNISAQFDIQQKLQNFAISLSTPVISFIKNFLIIILLMIFLLSEMHYSQEKINTALHGKAKNRVKEIVKHTIKETTRYVSIKFFFSLATGLLVFMGTLLLKLDFPIIWGFLAFILNFIPTFGSIISVVTTSLFALLQFFPKISPVILVFFITALINLVLGNFLEPKIEGKHLGLSPFIILVSLSVWGWMWGFVGMILAVPLTVMLKILCANVSFLHPFAIILGNDPKDTLRELSKVKEVYEDDIFSDEIDKLEEDSKN